MHSHGREAELPVHRMLLRAAGVLCEACPPAVRGARRRSRGCPRPQVRVRRGRRLHARHDDALVGRGVTVPDPTSFAARLRAGSPSVFCRVEDHVLFDVRTVPDDQLHDLARAIQYALEGDDSSTRTEPCRAALRVVATAGHVDHGKSSLIVRLTGIDPDRWEEEKRRGLTIDLGYAWCTLPSGREIGFVDVPGPRRFIGNMLAGVGPVRLVLFVVAADEGWKPQSEEHLQILDVLGVRAGVVALTKSDLVETSRSTSRRTSPRTLAGTALADAPIVPVSSTTGDGLDELAAALDAMLAAPGRPSRTRAAVRRPRVHDQGSGHRGDGHAHRRVPRRRRRGRGVAGRRRGADPLAPDPQADRGPRMPRLPRRREPRGRRARPAGTRRRARAPRGWRATARLRGAPAPGARTLARRHGARRVQALRRRGGDRRARSASTGRRSSSRAARRSRGSRRPRRWCWTSATGSCSARPAGGRPSRADRARRRAAAESRPRSGRAAGRPRVGRPRRAPRAAGRGARRDPRR